jgi:hypothetical protein
MKNIKNHAKAMFINPDLYKLECICTQQYDILEKNPPKTTINITLHEANEGTFNFAL